MLCDVCESNILLLGEKQKYYWCEKCNNTAKPLNENTVIRFDTINEAKLYQKEFGGSLSQNIHMCIDIEGLIRNKGKKSMAGIISGYSDGMVRQYMSECLTKGWRVIPIGECNNFDYQTGCKGHNIRIRLESEVKS
jgi:hypothetical protein